MRKRKYLIGALLSVVGALVVSGSASAAVTGQSLSVNLTPPKQQKKVFGPVSSMKTVVDMVGEEQARLILGGNAIRVFKLDQ